MNEENNTYQLIEDYLNGLLEGDALLSFETALRSSAELQKQVKLHRMANELVIDRKLAEIRKISSEEQYKYTQRSLRNKLLALAGLILLSVTGAYFFISDTQQTNTSENQSSAPTTEAIIDTNRIIVPDHTPNRSSIAKAHDVNNTASPVVKSTINAENQVQTKDTTAIIDKIAKDTLANTPKTPATATEPIIDIEPKAVTTPENPCLKNSPQTTFTTENTCTGTEHGKITIIQTQKGTAPYRYELYDVKLQRLPIESDLAAGFYTLHTIDKNNCSEYLEAIEIKNKKCPKDYHFNPSIGEVWQIPSYDYEGKLTVYNSSGKIAYQHSVNATFENTWNGVNNNGSIETGYYLFEIHYSNGYILHGSVTIVP